MMKMLFCVLLAGLPGCEDISAMASDQEQPRGGFFLVIGGGPPRSAKIRLLH
jgi:hypothetical protein